MPADDQHEHHDEFTTPQHDINASEVKAPESEETAHVHVAAEPHSIYTPREKWFIVALIAFGGLFSPLTSNIYFPVIPTLSEDFHRPIELINLTVTMYIVFQGLSPMFWGTLADSWGRRLMFIACLLLLAVSCIGLALVPTNAYWLLLFLRCFQSAGSASTIALGAGVIGDISEPAERAGFFGVYNIGPLVGPAIGPVLGGALADRLGWRAIFWFLCIAASACAIVLILLLPETLRSMVGNGSLPPPSPFLRPVLPLFGRRTRLAHPSTSTTPASPNAAPPRKRKPFQNPLRLLLNLDIVLLLFFNGLVCAVFYGVNASISTVFHETYPELSQTQLGLCFLAIGGGMLVGTVSSGKLLDWDFQRVKRSFALARAEAAKSTTEKNGLDADLSSKTETDMEKDEDGLVSEGFPIEKARMRLMPILVALFVASCVSYGWCIERRVNLGGPLVFIFGVGFFSIALMNVTQTLILDLVPSQGSSVTACNNLVRCALSATLVAVIQLILTPLGAGYTYVILGGICVAATPLVYVVMHIGPGWRARRKRRAEREKEREAGL